MRKHLVPAAVAAFFFFAVLHALAGTTVTPSTTLSIETGNNTSTSNSFPGWSNGNEPATNVSKTNIRTLLYPGASTKIFAHFLPWFGEAGHQDVGYNSADSAQVTRQVEDMMSRGIQGAIIDWYGQNGSHEDITTQYVMAAAESHSGFQFAVMEDAGAIRGCSSCQSALIGDLTYAYNKYEQSPAYFKLDGRPVVFFFDTDSLPGVNLTAAESAVPGNPIFVVKDAGGFSAVGADGAYSWVGDTFNNSDWGQAYLDYFYQTGVTSTARHSFGSTKKGFNDTQATWGGHRVIPQNCGQTWLNTFAEIGKYYSAQRQLENLQVVTWNDYEEGTALEMGIDNCLSISGAATGDVISWKVQGAENTVDHYTVFISRDGENLMPVSDVPTGTHQLDLSAYGFAQAAYTVYVKAVGRPSIRNHMSPAIAYHASGIDASVASAGVSATPDPVKVSAGQTGTVTVTVKPSVFHGAVSLKCTDLPAGFSCNFANPNVRVGSNPVSTTLNIAVAGDVSTASLRTDRSMPAFWIPGIGLGAVLAGTQRRSRKFWIGLMGLIAIAVLVSVGCGGGTMAAKSLSTSSSTVQSAQSAGYPVTIQASNGNTMQATVATVIVN